VIAVRGASYTGGILRDVGVGCIVAYAMGRTWAKVIGSPPPSARIAAVGIGAVVLGAAVGSMSTEAVARRLYVEACRRGYIRDRRQAWTPPGTVIDAEVVQ
jgi:hypothetical protein